MKEKERAPKAEGLGRPQGLGIGRSEGKWLEAKLDIEGFEGLGFPV